MIDFKVINRFFGAEVGALYKANAERINNLELIDFYLLKDFLGAEDDWDAHCLVQNLLVELKDGCLFVNFNNIFANLKSYSFEELQIKSTSWFADKIIFAYDKIYFQKYYYQITTLFSLVEYLRPRENAFYYDNDKVEILGKILANNSYLNIEQSCVIAVAFLKQFSIVSGGAGTGKSSVIVILLDLFTCLGIDQSEVYLLAFTGKATKRISEIVEKKYVGLNIQTIHRALGYNNEIRVAKLVIVDEATMVDVKLMVTLLQTLPKECIIILIGDVCQLSAIELCSAFELILDGRRHSCYSLKQQQFIASFCENFSFTNDDFYDDNVTYLLENYRSQKEILSFANSIYQKEIDMLSLCCFDWCSKTGIFSCHSDNLIDGLQRWLANQYDKIYFKIIAGFAEMTAAEVSSSEEIEKVFKRINKRKILSVNRVGFQGADYLNNYFFDKFKRCSNGSQGGYFSGLAVMITQNDYDYDVFNGDIGVIIYTCQGYYLFFQRGLSIVNLVVDGLYFEASFVLTVHKSQGSEYDEIFIIVGDEGLATVKSSMLYTAVTRAKNLVVLWGKPSIYQ